MLLLLQRCLHVYMYTGVASTGHVHGHRATIAAVTPKPQATLALAQLMIKSFVAASSDYSLRPSCQSLK